MFKHLLSFLLLQVTQCTTSNSKPKIPNKVDHTSVSTYYGKTLQNSSDLKTNACCSSAPPKHILSLIKNVHEDVVSKYYGCGLCIPDELEGRIILDLGCGAGRDVYIASQLVGPNGIVLGVDMTQEQLDVAQKYKDYHAELFGFDNVQFYKGYLEHLEDIKELQDDSIDIIISNCVINLCMDKKAVLKNCYRLLKQGGELYFSDVYCNKRVPESLRKDAMLWGECLSGALYYNDFINLAKRCGFADPRLVEDYKITIQNQEVIDKANEHGLEFYSATYRLFKVDDLEADDEDYGLFVTYKGTIPRNEDVYVLDSSHAFKNGIKTSVCGNTYRMLKGSRLSKHFAFSGDFNTHHGPFGGLKVPFTSAYQMNGKSSSCPSEKSSTAGCCPPSDKSSNVASCCPPKSKSTGCGPSTGCC